MKLWITKNSEVPVHDQLVAQITLGIASNDLKVGERLPSTRALARRFHVHQNTISAAYKELAARGLVCNKKGSGVFVRGGEEREPNYSLEHLFAHFVEEARARGYSLDEIGRLTRKLLTTSSVERYLVVESDPALREIVVAEILAATEIPISGISTNDLLTYEMEPGTQLVAMVDERSKVENACDANCVYLTPNSVPDAMTGRERPSTDELIAIVSGWDHFISLARLYLLAADIEPDLIVVCPTAESGWKRSSDLASMIICDFLTSKQFPDDRRVRVFPIIAKSSLEKLTC